MEQDLIVCPICDGSGHCVNCDGSGIDPNDYDKDCPVCGSDGICRECNGAGEVDQNSRTPAI